MSYEMKASRGNPALIVPVLDDSGSQASHLAGTKDPRFAWVAHYMGAIFKLLLKRSTESDGDSSGVVKARYFVHTILYGSRPVMWGQECMDIEAAVLKYTGEGNTLGLGGLLGGTDGKAALKMAYDFLTQAVQDPRFATSFPPMLFHMTDGESHTDASPVAEQIKQLTTKDGNVLMVNAYIGTSTDLKYAGPDDFPGYVDESDVGRSKDNLRLFNMSSVTPDCVHQYLVETSIFPQLRRGARLFYDCRTKDMLQHIIQVVGSIEAKANRTRQ